METQQQTPTVTTDKVKLFKRFLIADVLILIALVLTNTLGDSMYETAAPAVDMLEIGSLEISLFLANLALIIFLFFGYLGYVLGLKNWGRVSYTIGFAVFIVLASISSHYTNSFLIENPEILMDLDNTSSSPAFVTALGLVKTSLSAILVFMSWSTIKDKFR